MDESKIIFDRPDFKQQESRGVESALNRRSFLKLTGMATASLAAAGVLSPVLTGCQAEEAATEEPLGVAQPDYDAIVRTVCAPNCVQQCGHNCYVKDDTIIKVEPAEIPDPEGTRICLKGISNAMRRVYDPNRLKYPMRRVGERGSGDWERISWDEAYAWIAEEFAAIEAKYGRKAMSWIMQTGNSGSMITAAWSRITNTYGGSKINSAGLMSDSAAAMGYKVPLNTSSEGNGFEDMDGAKVGVFFGSNFASTAMNDFKHVIKAQENGMKMIVIDPRFTRTAAKADWWIPIRPGTDTALMLAMINQIIGNEWYDKEYLQLYTVAPLLVRSDTGEYLSGADLGEGEEANPYVVYDDEAGKLTSLPGSEYPMFFYFTPYMNNPTEPPLPAVTNPAIDGEFKVTIDGKEVVCNTAFKLLREYVEEFTPEYASEITEVPAEDIVKLATLYGTEDPACLYVTQGTTRYYSGHLVMRTGIIMASLCGNIGKAHAGANRAGGIMVPMIMAQPASISNPIEGWVEQTVSGARMYSNIPTGQPYPIKAMWIMSYGFGTQNPDMNRMYNEVYPALDFIVVSEQLMNASCDYADLILPVCSQYEQECDLVTSWFGAAVQIRKRVINPMYESKTDWQIFTDLAPYLGIEEYWQMSETETVKKMVTECNFTPVNSLNWDELYEKGVLIANTPVPHIMYEHHEFTTATGRVEFYSPKYLEFGEALPVYREPLESNRRELAKKYPFTFMTAHSLFSAHGTHINIDWVKEVNPEPRMEISPVDAEAKGLENGDTVRVWNDRGEFKVKVLVSEGIKPGCLNVLQGWWPEQFVSGHYSRLLHMETSDVQEAINGETNFSPYDNLVDIEKI